MKKRSSHPFTKVDSLHKQLRELAISLGPGAQLPTIRELCQQLGTTRVTLAEVLDQLESEQTLYRKHRQGIFVSSHIHHKSIHILYNANTLVTKTVSPFWSMLFVMLEDEAQRRAAAKDEEYAFHLLRSAQPLSNRLPEEALHILQSQRTHGVLSIGLDTRSMPEVLPDIPCVTFAAGGHWLVQLDGVETGYQATRTLLAQGCKHIELWLMYDEEQNLDTLTEVQGMRKALEEHGHSFSAEMVRRYRSRPLQPKMTHQEQGYALAHSSFNSLQTQRPDGIFIADDLITDGALVAFEDLGIRVGSDLRLVTHANVGSPILFGRTKNMTVLEYDPYDIVEAMFSMLERLMSKKTQPDFVTWIKPRLRVQVVL